MCEHENFFTAVNAPNNPEVQVACHDCKQFIGHPDDVIFGLKQEIAAANARIAELENKLTSHAPDGQQYNNAQFVELRQRTEQAEAQNKRLRNCGNCDKWRGCWGNPEEVPGMEICYRWENAKSGFVQDVILAETKRMREALEYLADYELCAEYSVSDAMEMAKAALEEKP